MKRDKVYLLGPSVSAAGCQNLFQSMEGELRRYDDGGGRMSSCWRKEGGAHVEWKRGGGAPFKVGEFLLPTMRQQGCMEKPRGILVRLEGGGGPNRYPCLYKTGVSSGVAETLCSGFCSNYMGPALPGLTCIFMPPLVEFKVALQIPPASLLIRKLAWLSSYEKLFFLISLFKTWDGTRQPPTLP